MSICNYIDNLSLNKTSLPCKSNISQFENNRLFTLKVTKNSMSKMKSQQLVNHGRAQKVDCN